MVMVDIPGKNKVKKKLFGGPSKHLFGSIPWIIVITLMQLRQTKMLDG